MIKIEATSAFSYYPESIDPNLFYIYSVTTPDTEPEELEIMIQNIIDDIAKNGVSENELQKSKIKS